MSVIGYRQNFQVLDSASASFSESQTSGLVAGQYTQPFSVTPFLKPYSLGVWMQFVGALTASAAEAPTSGTDSLDLFFNELEVSPSVGGETRSVALTRQFAEFAWVFCTDVNPNVAAAPTFTTSGTATVTTYLYVPLGGNAASVKVKLQGVATAVYAANVTYTFTSVTTYVISSNWSGIVAFQEQNTASLGSSLQSMLNYVQGAVAPDAIFLKGETSTTITQVTLITVAGIVLAQTTATAINQLGAAAICNVAGSTYTTSAGFVLTGNGQAFRTFQLAFSSATTHFIGYVQCAGGEDTLVGMSPGPTAAPPAVQNTGTVTPSGGVASVKSTLPTAAIAPGGAALKLKPGSAGGIISMRASTPC